METLNHFTGYTSVTPVSTTLDAVTNTIMKDSRLKYLTEQYRQSGDKDIKASTPVFSVACVFEGGKQMKHVTALTGMSLVDCDHVSPERLADIIAKARADPHTLLAYTTISGSGLRIIFRYERDTGMDLKKQLEFYTKVFAYGNDYYAKLLNVPVDGQCKNVTRLSGMAYDPDAWYNPDAQPFGTSEIAAHWKRHMADKKKGKRLRNVQSLYDKTLAAELEEEGAVYTAGRHNDYIMRLCYKLNQFGISENDALQWLMDTFPDYDQTETTLRSCYRNIEEFGIRSPYRNKRYNRQQGGNGGKPDYAGPDAIKAFLSEYMELRKNVVSARTEYRMKKEIEDICPGSIDYEEFQPITDSIVNTIWAEMSKTVKVSCQDISRIMDSAFVKPFHPFKLYLESLPPWKEGDTDYILELSRTVTVKGGIKEQWLFYEYLRKWIVGMVGGWIKDLVINNVILVLIGEQGVYKTTWFNRLLPPPLQRYFYTKTNAGRLTKDDLIVIASYGLVCYEELDSMRLAELNQLKATVTTRSIDERAAYARYNEHRPHIASFCGTGNNVQFLADPTGNRRWLPFEVERIVSPYDSHINYEGIYSQAYSLFKDNFRFWFTAEDIERLNRHNRHFETPRLEYELVMLYFEKPTDIKHGIFMPTASILQYVSANISQKLSPVWIGRALSDLGFEKLMQNNVRGYKVVPRTVEEVRRYQERLALQEDESEERDSELSSSE
ncbi:MAG: BT4734/BF3469 family protein [Prevotellaceae bacterium]|nr:BT4734/BF3469 family protein [Prevotellaceae bacterium]